MGFRLHDYRFALVTGLRCAALLETSSATVASDGSILFLRLSLCRSSTQLFFALSPTSSRIHSLQSLSFLPSSSISSKHVLVSFLPLRTMLSSIYTPLRPPSKISIHSHCSPSHSITASSAISTPWHAHPNTPYLGPPSHRVPHVPSRHTRLCPTAAALPTTKTATASPAPAFSPPRQPDSSASNPARQCHQHLPSRHPGLQSCCPDGLASRRDPSQCMSATSRRVRYRCAWWLCLRAHYVWVSWLVSTERQGKVRGRNEGREGGRSKPKSRSEMRSTKREREVMRWFAGAGSRKCRISSKYSSPTNHGRKES
jgi:hypothetical protein